MRERDWTNTAPEAGDVIKAPDVTVRCLATGGAALISGDLAAGIAALAPGAPMIGLLDTLPDAGACALRVARDRALLCTSEPLEAAPGWNDGYATSAADDLYVPIQIEGDADKNFLASCMSVSAGGSPSAATLFAEKPCLVARAGATVRVWVPRHDSAEVWTRLALLSGT